MEEMGVQKWWRTAAILTWIITGIIIAVAVTYYLTDKPVKSKELIKLEGEHTKLKKDYAEIIAKRKEAQEAAGVAKDDVKENENNPQEVLDEGEKERARVIELPADATTEYMRQWLPKGDGD